MVKKSRYRLLWVLLFGTGLFNVLDYFFTLKALGMGYEEANPLVKSILHTPLFPIYKLLMVPSLLILIWVLRKKVGKRLIIYTGTLFTVYLLLMVYFAGFIL